MLCAGGAFLIMLLMFALSCAGKLGFTFLGIHGSFPFRRGPGDPGFPPGSGGSSSGYGAV